MKTLYEKQMFLEQHVVIEAQDKKRGEIKKKQVDGREHELSYGSEFIYNLKTCVLEIIKDKHKNNNQKNNFYLYCREEHLKYVAGETEYLMDPDEVISNIISVFVIKELSKAPPMMNVVSNIHKSIVAYLRIDSDTVEELRDHAFAYIGALIDMGGLASGIYEARHEGGNDHRRLFITEEYKLKLDTACEKSLIHCETHFPMIVPPKKHKNLVSGAGGYLFLNSPLLKHPSRVDRSSIVQFDNPYFFNKINRLQETGYCINTKLLSVIQSFDKNGKHFDGYLTYRDQGLIEAEYEREVEAKQQNYNEVAEFLGVEPYTVTETSKKTIMNKVTTKVMNEVHRVRDMLEQADMYAAHDSIYFPMFCDHRSRMYPYASTLSYQGCQMSKALLQHSKKEAFTDSGINSLLETLGNTLGFDKLNREEKVDKAEAWWLEHSEDFYSGNFNIFVDKQHDFDEPITALAIVLELIEHAKDPEYKSGFIAHRDARCSGASIIGTCLQDKRIMELTSVIDYVDENGRLGDAYSEVVNTAVELCKNIMKSGSKEANILIENYSTVFNRNVFKKAVMCFASYGMTDYGLREHTNEVIDWEDEDNNLTAESKKLFDSIVKEAIKKAIPSCFNYLDTIRIVASEVVEERGFISYKNPITEFPVILHKFKEIKSSITIPSKPKDFKLCIYKETGKTNKRGIVSEAAPSIIHNLDSTLLMSVLHFTPEDISVTMIHDSIGSHPNHTDKIIEAYSKSMYIFAKESPLDKIFAQLGTDIRVPKVNTCSDADLRSILSSHHILC